MTKYKSTFLEASEKISFDKEHRRKIHFNIGKYKIAVKKGKDKIKDLELGRKRLFSIRQKSIENLDKYVIEFARNFESKGGKIIWANDSHEAIEGIIAVIENYGAKYLMKSKSMLTEELDFNEELEKRKIESVETDLGEFIVQVAGEKPYHIITPAMHKSKGDVAKLFNEKFNLDINSTPEELTAYVRKVLKEKFKNSIVGVTGANFLISDTGSIALTENEGNGVLSVAFPKVHIAIAGIEKIIPSINDLSKVWPMLSVHGTGQSLTVYNTLMNGPKKADEIDGPEELYLVLINNKRDNLLEKKDLRESLQCIKCGACLNECPIYRNIGGYTYKSVYSGPIGSVISQHIFEYEKYSHLSFACTICGRCTEICPVHIEITKMQLINRRNFIKSDISPKMEKYLFKGWEMAMKNRFMLDIGNTKLKNKFIKFASKNSWSKRRNPLQVKKKSFRKLWMDLNNKD